MPFIRKSLEATIALLTMAGAALAHPGHGTTDPHGVTHYVVEPVHLAPLALIFALAVAGISVLAGRRRPSR